MRIIPLGTSSGKPTLKRNVSALAIAREAEWLLLDCGESTQLQIARAGLSPSRLSGVFITHLHGDHFNGLPGLLSSMGLDARERALTVAGPPGVVDYLNTLTRLKVLSVPYPLDVREFGPKSFRAGKPAVGHAGGSRRHHTTTESEAGQVGGSAVVYETERFQVQARPLAHRIFDLGYRIDEVPRPGRFDLERAHALGIPEGPLFGRLQQGHTIRLEDGRYIKPEDVLGPPRPGKSLAYCLDTRPCAGDVELARGVDLLLHEATFAEDLIDEAMEYGHSTSAMAAKVASSAGAEQLVITHISARYADATHLLDQARELHENTVLAEDL